MTTTPQFASTVKTGVVSIGTAETSRGATTPTNFGILITAASNGTRIDEITIVATGTTTAGVVRIFVYNGSTYYLLREVLVSAITPSTTVAVFSSTLVFSNLVIPSTYSIRVTTNNSETFHVTAFGGDF
jgi:hypothetical protein